MIRDVVTVVLGVECIDRRKRRFARPHRARKNGADVVLVVGSRNSSNSNRLVEVSQNLGTNSYLIDKADDIRPEWIENVNTVAITAGASAPEVLVQDVVHYLQGKGYGSVEEIEVMPENVRFGLPPEIIKAIGSAPVAQPTA